MQGATISAEINYKVAENKGTFPCLMTLLGLSRGWGGENNITGAKRVLELLFPNGEFNNLAVGVVSCGNCPGFKICEKRATEQILANIEPFQGSFFNS